MFNHLLTPPLPCSPVQHLHGFLPQGVNNVDIVNRSYKLDSCKSPTDETSTDLSLEWL